MSCSSRRALAGALVITAGLCFGSALAAPRVALPNAPLREHTVAGEVQKMRFVSVTAAMQADASKPATITFGVAPDAAMKLSRLVGMPYGVVALYRRLPAVGENAVEPERMWDLQVVANLEPKNVKGNLMVVVYDREDPTTVTRHAFVAMWEATASPFKYLGLRLLLDPESDGFKATHTYLLQIVQQWSQRERVLSQGTFRLE